MPEINHRKRLLIAFLWAVVLGVVFGMVGHATSDGDIVVKPLGICDFLEPYTYWWGFWGCE